MALRPETHQALVEVIDAHHRKDIKGCMCGKWGSDHGDLGKSHSVHVVEMITPVIEQASYAQNQRMVKATLEALIMAIDSMKRVFLGGVAQMGSAVQQRVAHQNGEGIDMVIGVLKNTLGQHVDKMEKEGLLDDAATDAKGS